MKARLAGPDLTFQYALIDARELDGAVLLASDRIEDNLMAILTRSEDRTGVIREILGRIANLQPSARREALAQFLVISGVRRLGRTIRGEASKMPILNDILDHDLFGPMILQGRQQGRQDVLRRQLKERFVPIPHWVETRLMNLPAADLDDLAVFILRASRLEDLFPPKP